MIRLHNITTWRVAIIRLWCLMSLDVGTLPGPLSLSFINCQPSPTILNIGLEQSPESHIPISTQIRRHHLICWAKSKETEWSRTMTAFWWCSKNRAVISVSDGPIMIYWNFLRAAIMRLIVHPCYIYVRTCPLACQSSIDWDVCN